MNSNTLRQIVFATLLLLVFATGAASAQRRFPYQFDLDSRKLDTLYSPDATSPLHRYRITAWGTYSMWEDTVNSSVDPMWIYSFPAEEWAKPEWRIFPEGPPIYVGDGRLLNSHGLRINDSAMPKQPLAPDHRYVMEIQGTGRPVSTTIVDWNFKNFIQRDAHDNNSGYLHVLVEELPLLTIDVCGIDSTRFPYIRLAVKVMRDSVRQEDFLGSLVITENGVPVHIDSMDCSERASAVSAAMVFDRSGSMNESFGNSTRMEYTRAAGVKFVGKLGAADEAAVYSFDESTRLDQTWTSNTTALKNAINNLQPGGWTAMNDAVMRAIADIEARPASRRKAIIVLSDGEDNRSAVTAISTVIARARAAGVPVFAIGLLLDSDDSLRALAAQTGGRYYSVRDPAAMDSVFASIAEIVFAKGCCTVYYTSPDPRRNGTNRAVTPSLVEGGGSVSGPVVNYHAPGGSSGVAVDRGSDAGRIVSVTPNPLGDEGDVRYVVGSATHVTIDVLDVQGRRVAAVLDAPMQAGEHVTRLALRGLPNGRYFVRIALAGHVAIQPLLLMR